MNTTLIAYPLPGFVKQLVQEGYLNESSAIAAIQMADTNKISVISHLMSEYSIAATIIAHAISQELNYPLFDLDNWNIQLMPQNAFSIYLIKQYRVLPLFKTENILHLAISDPIALSCLDVVTFQIKEKLQIHIVEDNKLSTMIKKLTFNSEIKNLDILEQHSLLSGNDIQTYMSEKPEAPDHSITHLIHNVILDAISHKVSDIHFEPCEAHYRIRFRQDGLLREVTILPLNIATRLMASLKVMACLDSTERRLPQDGHIKINAIEFEKVDLRISTCPTVFGEKIVLRILDQNTLHFSIDKIGLEEHQKALFLKTLEKPQGLILITGPTGSGKTATLYSALNILNAGSRNIMTAEDPVEIYLRGIQQVNIHPQIGFHFANALRAFLRQDPDVLMVGEIRDEETAKTALQAAETGHLVLSTLHTNSAADTVYRLLQMGIPPYLLANTLSLVVAQRLVRQLCEYCKIQIPLTTSQKNRYRQLKDPLDDFPFYGPKGCQQCYQGYLGRTGIFELLPVTDIIKSHIYQNSTDNSLKALLKAEMQGDLEYTGFHKAVLGITSLEELQRVI